MGLSVFCFRRNQIPRRRLPTRLPPSHCSQPSSFEEASTSNFKDEVHMPRHQRATPLTTATAKRGLCFLPQRKQSFARFAREKKCLSDKSATSRTQAEALFSRRLCSPTLSFEATMPLRPPNYNSLKCKQRLQRSWRLGVGLAVSANWQHAASARRESRRVGSAQAASSERHADPQFELDH